MPHALHVYRELVRLLSKALYDLGYQPEHRSYTPLEVRVIVDALGEP